MTGTETGGLIMSHDETGWLRVNEAGWDRALRLGVVVGILALGVAGFIAEGTAAALRVASVPLLLTAIVGWCPLYEALGVRTCRN